MSNKRKQWSEKINATEGQTQKIYGIYRVREGDSEKGRQRAHRGQVSHIQGSGRCRQVRYTLDGADQVCWGPTPSTEEAERGGTARHFAFTSIFRSRISMCLCVSTCMCVPLCVLEGGGTQCVRNIYHDGNDNLDNNHAGEEERGRKINRRNIKRSMIIEGEWEERKTRA